MHWKDKCWPKHQNICYSTIADASYPSLHLQWGSTSSDIHSQDG